jgi:hypothetical protein
MGGAGGAEGEEETDQAAAPSNQNSKQSRMGEGADWTYRAAPSTDKTEGIGRDSRAGRRLEERASRRAGAGGRAGRRGETGDARTG